MFPTINWPDSVNKNNNNQNKWSLLIRVITKLKPYFRSRCAIQESGICRPTNRRLRYMSRSRYAFASVIVARDKMSPHMLKGTDIWLIWSIWHTLFTAETTRTDTGAGAVVISWECCFTLKTHALKLLTTIAVAEHLPWVRCVKPW